MAIGRYRDDPREMDTIEREVAAAQYPEGALVAGMGLGMTVPLVVAPMFSAPGAIVGGLFGYGFGRWFRRRTIRERRAASERAE